MRVLVTDAGKNFVEMKQKLEKFALIQNFSTKNSPHSISNNNYFLNGYNKNIHIIHIWNV